MSKKIDLNRLASQINLSKPGAVKVVKTNPIKLKDRPGKGGVHIKFPSTQIPFVPTGIVIRKVFGENNTIIVNFIKPEVKNGK